MTDDSVPQIPLHLCKKCGNEYPVTAEFFYRDKQRKSGFAFYCRTCVAAKRAEFYSDPNNRKKANAQKKIYDDAHREQRRAYVNQYYADNKERIAVRVRQYQIDNPEKTRERQRQYALNNPEVIRAKSARYRERHRESERAKGREYNARNRDKRTEYNRQWLANNPDRVTHYHGKRRALKHNSYNNFTLDDRKYALEYWGGCCAVCGRPAGLWHTIAMDHWLALTRGGDTVPQNMLPLCHDKKGGQASCNNVKNGRLASEWLIEKLGERRAKDKLKEIELFFLQVRKVELDDKGRQCS